MDNKIIMEARFTFTGKLKKDKRLQDRIIRNFMKQRGLLVDILNNRVIDILNKEFDAAHEWYDGIYFDKEYMKFMQEGQQKYADIVNKHADTNTGIELFIDKEGDIYGKTTEYFTRTPEEIHMYLVPMKDEIS